jgi:hypothetical protein
VKAVIEQDLQAIQEIYCNLELNSEGSVNFLKRVFEQLVLFILNPHLRATIATRYGYQFNNDKIYYNSDIFILNKLAIDHEAVPVAINTLITMCLDKEVDIWTRGSIPMYSSDLFDLRLSCDSFTIATTLELANISFKEYLSSIFSSVNEGFLTAVQTLFQSGGREHFSGIFFKRVRHRIRLYIDFWISKSHDSVADANDIKSLCTILSGLFRLATMIEGNVNTFLHYVSEYGGPLYLLNWAISQS